MRLIFSFLLLLFVNIVFGGNPQTVASQGSTVTTHNGGQVITAQRPGSGHHPSGGHHRWGKPKSQSPSHPKPQSPPQPQLQPQPPPKPQSPPQPKRQSPPPPKPQSPPPPKPQSPPPPKPQSPPPPKPQSPPPPPKPQLPPPPKSQSPPQPQLQPPPPPKPQSPPQPQLQPPPPPPQPQQHLHPAKLFGWDPERAKERCGSNCSNLQYFLQQQEFLLAHNWVRVLYKQPLYTWDEKLATEARVYVSKQAQDCKVIHSDLPYGENIFWGKNLHWGPSDAVYYWYIEKQWFDFGKLECAAPLDKNCGHFTQIVWKDSMRLGCAIQHCRDTSLGMLIICEYDPPGNYENENPLATNQQA